MKRQTKSADEIDATSRWRRYYCYLQRPGACKKIKSRMNRRDRHKIQQQLRNEEND